MQTLDRLLGDPFFDLLEASAEQVCRRVQLLSGAEAEHQQDAQSVSSVRQQSRAVAAAIETRLAHKVMASLKKEDIEALSTALLRITEAVDRLAHRWTLAREKVSELDLTHSAEILDQSAATVLQMVRQLRLFESLATTIQLHDQLQTIAEATEANGEKMIQGFYQPAQDPIKLLVVRDMVGHLTAVSQCCLACGDLVYETVLKYS